MAVDRERGTGGVGSLVLFLVVAAALWAAAGLVALTIALFFVYGSSSTVTAIVLVAASVVMLVGLGFATRLLAWAMEAPRAGTAVVVIVVGLLVADVLDTGTTLPDLLQLSALGAVIAGGWWVAGRRLRPAPEPVGTGS